MVIEFRTYTVKTGSLADVIERFGAGYATRADIKPITAFFYTVIGPLDQIIQVWSWDDMTHREQIRIEVNKLDSWPPGLGPNVIHQEVELFNEMPFLDNFPAGDHGPVFEMRTTSLPPGAIRTLRGAAENTYADRAKISPVLAALHTDMGTLNKFVHIYGYPSLEAMQAANDAANSAGGWPPIDVDGGPVFQSSTVMRAGPFSPIQ
ncbi:MAG: NIPSNAP family protein [Proteobacteria bacterium]|nr:NIPSNAP family protein [Pseudomonadota bacterium]